MAALVDTSQTKTAKKLHILNQNVTTVNNNVTAVDAKVDAHHAEFNSRLEALEKGPGSTSGRSSISRLSDNLTASLSTAATEAYIPIKMRRVICVGGLGYDDGNEHAQALRDELNRLGITYY